MKTNLKKMFSLLLFMLVCTSTSMIFAQEDDSNTSETIPVENLVQEESLAETKIKMPTTAQLNASKKIVDELLQNDIEQLASKNKTASELAEKCTALLDEAEEVATKYLLYQYMSEYYAVDMNFEEVVKIQNTLDEMFKDYNAGKEVLKALKKSIQKINAENAEQMLEFIITLGNNFLLNSDLKSAGELISLTRSVQQKFRKSENLPAYQAFIHAYNDRKNADAKLKSIEKALSKNSNDPKLNFSYGISVLTLKGNWDEALPYLVKGSDKAFAEIATLELTKPTDQNEILKIGDFYWDLSKGNKTILGTLYREHAVSFYSIVVDELSGLRKKLVETKIEDAGTIETQESSIKKDLIPKLDVKIPDEFDYDIGNGQSIKLIKVNKGSFMMGSPRTQTPRQDDEVQHKVTITKDYWIATIEMRYNQWCVFEKGTALSQDRIIRISWTQAMDYCEKVTEKARRENKIPSNYEFRLPTEAEWEYAARGGHKSQNFIYAGSNVNDGLGSIPNELGLYQMNSYILEWCYDWYAPYDIKQAKDPTGPKKGNKKVVRGGWKPPDTPNSWRDSKPESVGYDGVGLRIVLAPIIKMKKTKQTRSTKPEKMSTAKNMKYKIAEGLEIELVKVEKGSFIMGSPLDQKNRVEDEKQHKVTITKDYWISVTEITEPQWNVIENPDAKNVDPTLPIQHHSWTFAMKYCEKLTKNARQDIKIPSDYEFRLPTEAEWEYAARGGEKSKNFLYAGTNTASEAGKANRSSADLFNVKSSCSNELGIYMMSGCVWEWCYDWYDEYDPKQNKDPIGPKEGIYKVIRGGRIYDENSPCSKRNKCRNVEGDRGDWNLGFRIVLAPIIKR